MSPFSSMRERVAAAQHMQRFRRDSDPERDYRLLLQYREVEPAFLRLGYITCDKLAALRFEVESDALLGGRIAPTFDRYCSFEERMKYETLCFEEYYQKKINGQTGHCELFLDDLFALGIHGVQEKIL